MYYKLHEIQVELTVYKNDWKKLDFIRRCLVVLNGNIMEFLLNNKLGI